MLPRIVGQGRAAELLYTGRSMAATEGLWVPLLVISLDGKDISEPGTPDAGVIVRDGQEYLSPQDVGRIVDLHPRVIQRAVNEGDIPAYKLRGKIRIRHDELLAWVASNRVEPYSVPDFDGD